MAGHGCRRVFPTLEHVPAQQKPTIHFGFVFDSQLHFKSLFFTFKYIKASVIKSPGKLVPIWIISYQCNVKCKRKYTNQINWLFNYEMGPDLTRAYFLPTVNKGPIHLWPGYFLTRPDTDVANPTQSGQQKNDPTQVENFWPWPITNFFHLTLRLCPTSVGVIAFDEQYLLTMAFWM